MGWMVMNDPWYTKSRLVKFLVSESQWAGASCKPVRHSVVGNHLWILLDRVSGEGSPQEIALYLLQGRRPGDEPGGWGYKGLPIREHLDCPAYMLDADLCPEYYGGWITQVRQEQAEARELGRRVKALQPGAVLVLHGRRYRLGARLRGGWVVQEVTDGAKPVTYSMKVAQARQALREASQSPPGAPCKEQPQELQAVLL